MAFTAGQQKTDGQSRWRSLDGLGTAPVDVARFVGTTLILNQLEYPRLNGGQRVAQGAAQPPRKRRDRNTHRGRGGVAAVIVGCNRRQIELLHLLTEPPLDGPEQPFLGNLGAVARIPIV